ncbi:MAG: hydrogenase maturation protease [Saprospiraceae bacterium]|nr:hydrogenase maturation protease [Saprospiraceae bacterium]
MLSYKTVEEILFKLEPDRERILVIGIGNSARQDDGVGWKFLELIDALGLPLEYREVYQLQIEDASLITGFDKIIFVDSHVDQIKGGYQLEPVFPLEDATWTTHTLSPAGLMHLAEQLFDHTPEAWLLAITGYRWDLGEPMTADAKANLFEAFEFLRVQLG